MLEEEGEIEEIDCMRFKNVAFCPDCETEMLTCADWFQYNPHIEWIWCNICGEHNYHW